MKYRSGVLPTLAFLLLAAGMLIVADIMIWRARDSAPPGEKPHMPVIVEGADFDLPALSEIEDYASAGKIMRDLPYIYPQPSAEPAAEPEKAAPPVIRKPAGQFWREHAVPAGPAGRLARIVIIIDDMGMSRKYSHETIDLPAPLTLAFLPYAPGLGEITAQARAKGHELLIHAPMEPLDRLNPGPLALLDGMSDEQLRATLHKMLGSFSGYVGINNHMGSKLTQNEAAMHVVMNELADRGLIFVDSKTINSSVAGRVAALHGLDYAERDVFLDHEDNIDFVRSALLQAERHARKYGVAVAIGHPKSNTISALKEWLPLAKARGFTVVPVSAVVRRGASAVQVSAEAAGAVYGPLPEGAGLSMTPTLEPYPRQSPRP